MSRDFRRVLCWSLALSCLLMLAGAPAEAATYTQYTSQASFFTAAGLSAPTQTFDGSTLPSGTCLDGSDGVCGIAPPYGCPTIPGVTFWSDCSVVTTPNYNRITVQASAGAVTPDRLLTGGYDTDVDAFPFGTQSVVMGFSAPSPVAVGFYLTGLSPVASPAGVFVTFDDDSSANFSVGDTDGDASTAEFFGLVVSDARIDQIWVTSGQIVSGEFFYPNIFGIDNLSFAATVADTLPPICSRVIDVEAPLTEVFGRATDNRPSDTGVDAVTFAETPTNLTLTVLSEFPVSVADFTVTLTDPNADGHGVVLATDVAGNSCTLRIDLHKLPDPPAPLVKEVLCSGDGILFEVSNPASPGGYSACSSNLYTPSEPALPPGYFPSPPDDPFPCRVLTIDSDITGDTEMIYKKDGVFDPRLRLLFSASTDGGVTFPAFTDVTDKVEQIDTIVPDPTRLIGTSHWTPVKVTCAILEGVDCATFANPTLNADGDGYPICSAGVRSDCNDQRNFIYPGAPELCNGMDDNCNGVIDEGDPGGGASCTVPGKYGICAAGVEHCTNGEVVCTQTVFPATEICNGLDDNCNGLVDENHVFGGYLPPVNPDGSSIFKWKRTIPFKFQLTTCTGAFVSTEQPTIAVFFYQSGIVGSEVEDVGSAGNANSGNLYRYDATANQYIYNFDTKTLRAGNSYLVRTTLDDGSTHDVVISIR